MNFPTIHNVLKLRQFLEFANSQMQNEQFTCLSEYELQTQKKIHDKFVDMFQIESHLVGGNKIEYVLTVEESFIPNKNIIPCFVSMNDGIESKWKLNIYDEIEPILEQISTTLRDIHEYIQTHGYSNLVNLTSTPIRLYDQTKTRVTSTLEPEKNTITAKYTRSVSERFGSHSLASYTFDGVENLPEMQTGTYYIIPYEIAVVLKDALFEREDILVPDYFEGAVYSTKNELLGTTGFMILSDF